MLLCASCSATGEYRYAPAAPANAQVEGVPAQGYAIPPGQPRGDVRLVSSGLTDVQPQGRGGDVTRVLHVRLVVTNAADVVPWTVDTRAIVVSLGGEDRSVAAYVSTDAGSPPYVQIAPGQRGTVDLYYPLPPALRHPEQVPSFQVEWQVQTGRGVVGQRTPFQRIEEPAERGVRHDRYGQYFGYPFPF